MALPAEPPNDATPITRAHNRAVLDALPFALGRPAAPLATCGSIRPPRHPAAVAPSVGLVTPI